METLFGLGIVLLFGIGVMAVVLIFLALACYGIEMVRLFFKI